VNGTHVSGTSSNSTVPTGSIDTEYDASGVVGSDSVEVSAAVVDVLVSVVVGVPVVVDSGVDS
jgi:hypothetical protein